MQEPNDQASNRLKTIAMDQQQGVQSYRLHVIGCSFRNAPAHYGISCDAESYSVRGQGMVRHQKVASCNINFRGDGLQAFKKVCQRGRGLELEGPQALHSIPKEIS